MHLFIPSYSRSFLPSFLESFRLPSFLQAFLLNLSRRHKHIFNLKLSYRARPCVPSRVILYFWRRRRMLDAFIGKFSKDQRKDLSEIHGVLWEEDDSVQNCRDCNSKFTVSLRKHHCRGCGGIYCENCSSPDVTLKANSQSVRACVFCQRGETPGENIVRLIQTAIERKGDKVSIFPPAQPLSILRGSLYGDDDSRSIRLDGKPSHNFGYFEIVNKSNEMAAFKVIQGGGDSMRELCRPAYFTGNIFYNLLLLFFSWIILSIQFLH